MQILIRKLLDPVQVKILKTNSALLFLFLLVQMIDSSSSSGGRSIEGEQPVGCPNSDHMDSAGQATSLSSLEEMAPGLAKRTRRKLTFDPQCSDSNSWIMNGEDGASERVRFDDHVSVIEADQERVVGGKLEGCTMNNRSTGGRKRNKDPEQETEAQKTSKYEL